MNQATTFPCIIMPKSGIADLFTGLSLFQLFDDLVMFGKSARLELGVNHIAVGDHIEYAATTGDQFCINPKNSLQFVRQTGGSRFVVSFCTVVNFDLHGRSPFYSMGKERPESLLPP
jgi:hypothetical protein